MTGETVGTPYHHEDERECYQQADGSGWEPWRYETGVAGKPGDRCDREHPGRPEVRQFPIPFAGVCGYVELTPEELRVGVEALMGCDHPHNFAVELDSTPRIYTTELGAQCIKEALDAHTT